MSMTKTEIVKQLARYKHRDGLGDLNTAVLCLFGVRVEWLPKSGWRRWLPDASRWGAVPRFTSELSECVRLVEEQMPGCGWSVIHSDHGPTALPYGAIIHRSLTDMHPLGIGEANTPTGALLIALINAAEARDNG